MAHSLYQKDIIHSLDMIREIQLVYFLGQHIQESSSSSKESKHE